MWPCPQQAAHPQPCTPICQGHDTGQGQDRHSDRGRTKAQTDEGKQKRTLQGQVKRTKADTAQGKGKCKGKGKGKNGAGADL